MEIKLICVGKIKEGYFSDAVKEYSKRLSRFTKFSIIEVPDIKIPANASAKEEELILQREGEAVLSKLRGGEYVISMCVEGKQLDSEEFAAELENALTLCGTVVFIIGGSLGLSGEVKSRSRLRLSFGKITLPHRLMRVVLCEQIYRAFKINRNEQYHK